MALERWQVTNTDCIIEDESLECLSRETVIVSKEVQPNLEVQVKDQDPLDEVNLGTKDEPKPTYVSAWLDPITRCRHPILTGYDLRPARRDCTMTRQDPRSFT